MAELLEIITQAFPSPLEHPLPPVTSAVTGEAVDRADLRPGRAAARRGREDHLRPLRRAGSPWSGCSPARCGPDMSVHVSGHGRAERGHPDHDDDERVGALTVAARQAAAAARRRARPGSICAVAKLSHGGDRRHAVRRGSSRCSWSRGRCPSRCCRSRSWPGRRRTRTSCPPRSPAGRRGPDDAAGDQRRDPPARAVVHGRGARGRAARPAVRRGTASRSTP